MYTKNCSSRIISILAFPMMVSVIPRVFSRHILPALLRIDHCVARIVSLNVAIRVKIENGENEDCLLNSFGTQSKTVKHCALYQRHPLDGIIVLTAPRTMV